MIVTLLLVAAVVALVFGIVLPELIRTGTNLITNMPGYLKAASVWVNKLLEDNPAILSYINDIIQQINLDEMSSRPDAVFAGQRTDPETSSAPLPAWWAGWSTPSSASSFPSIS